MKKYIYPLILIIILLSSITAYSHPGRTDANGGHWNRSTGEYHFHTGEYAGRDHSSSSSYKTDSKAFKPPYEPPTENPYKTNASKKSKEPSIIDYTILIVIACFFAINFLYFILFEVLPEIFNKWLPNTNFNNYYTARNNFLNCYKKRKKTEMIVQKNRLEDFIPEGYNIDSDGLPREKGIDAPDYWGDTLTLYTPLRHGALHKKQNCSNAQCHPVNVIDFYVRKKISERNLCKKCCRDYIVPDLEWVFKCHEVLADINHLSEIKEQEQKELNELKVAYNKCQTKFIKFILFFSHQKRQQLNNIDSNFQKILKLYD